MNNAVTFPVQLFGVRFIRGDYKTRTPGCVTRMLLEQNLPLYLRAKTAPAPDIPLQSTQGVGANLPLRDIPRT